MVRTYTILGTHDELEHSSLVRDIHHTFDVVLTIGKPTVVNFLLQFPISLYDLGDIYAIYDDESLTVSDIVAESFVHQTLISTTITIKEVGATSFTLSVPLAQTGSPVTYTAKKVPTK